MTTEAPAGWYDDPQVQDQQRYWDGAAWTDQVQAKLLFDGMLNLNKVIGNEQQRLVVTANELWWGEEYVRWDDVVSFSQLTTMMAGIPQVHEMVLALNDRNVRVGFRARVKRDPIGDRAFAVLVHQLQQTLGVRVLTGLMQMVERGEPVRVAGLLLSPEGFMNEKKDKPMIPWSEFAGIELVNNEGIYANLFRFNDGGKRKRAMTVPVDMLRSWVVRPVVEEHARRYVPVNPDGSARRASET